MKYLDATARRQHENRLQMERALRESHARQRGEFLRDDIGDAAALDRRAPSGGATHGAPLDGKGNYPCERCGRSITAADVGRVHRTITCPACGEIQRGIVAGHVRGTTPYPESQETEPEAAPGGAYVRCSADDCRFRVALDEQLSVPVLCPRCTRPLRCRVPFLSAAAERRLRDATRQATRPRHGERMFRDGEPVS